PCKESRVEHHVSYINLSSDEAIELINKEKNLAVLDVRPALQFDNRDTLAENNTGRIKNAVNVPYDQLKQKMPELEKYIHTPLLVYTASGDGDAARTANELTAAGF